jgi:tetratricopeptide (TPR) repeat protein
LVETYVAQGRNLTAAGKAREAEEAFRQATVAQEQLETALGGKAESRLDLALSHFSSARLFQEAGRFADADRFQGRAVALLEQQAAEFPGEPGHRAELAGHHYQLATLRQDSGRPGEAQKSYRRAIELQEKIAAEFPTVSAYRHKLGRYHNGLGHSLADTSRREAEQAFRRALAIYEQLTEENHPDRNQHRHDLAWTCLELAEFLESDRRPDEALPFYARVGGLCEKLDAERPGVLDYPEWHSSSCGALGFLLTAANRPQEAERAFRKVFALRPSTSTGWYRHALVHLHLGEPDGYRQACAALLERFSENPSEDDVYWTEWTCALGPGAVTDWRPIVRLAEKRLAAFPKDCDRLQHFGAVLYRAGQYPEAVKRLAEAEAAFGGTKNSRSSALYGWLFRAMAEHRLGHAEEAKKWLAKTVQAIDRPEKADGPVPWNRCLTLQLLRREAEEVLSKKGRQ